ncbi:MAG: 3-dehydroquinate synthase [Clostridia bacterium]|nr:3-dehydroquinate synthase [Clostridia bacterium]
MTVRVNLGSRSYQVLIERGCLSKAGGYLDLDRNALIVTDSGVPEKYADTIASQCRKSTVVTVPEGERSKSFSELQNVISKIMKAGLNRGDCLIAVGGGVVGDLAGFASSVYMRGIDFYNVPTTVLSQVDSSVGGKTAIDFSGIKNIVGTFHQPSGVLIDPDVLSTLPPRHISNGLAEALKESVTFDAELFSLFENGDPMDRIDEIIARSVMIKARVIENDEKESGLRKVLNFGHTVGHAVESVSNGAMLHGNCVAIGMVPMCGDSVRDRVTEILSRLGLPVSCGLDPEDVLKAALMDKKANRDGTDCVFSDSVGSYRMETVTKDKLRSLIETVCTGG